MFVNLPKNTGIYGLSAANPSESSWGTYCSPDDVVQAKHIGSCLGDLFSVNFVEDTDKGNFDETLFEQFGIIQKLTTKSHVMQWGDLSFQTDKIGQFLSGNKRASNLRLVKPIRKVGSKASASSMMDSRTMRLQSLSAVYSRDHSKETFQEMVEEMASMQRYDSIFNSLGKNLSVTGIYDASIINFECLRTTIDTFETKCGKFSDYGLGFIKFLAEACEKHPSTTVIEQMKC